MEEKRKEKNIVIRRFEWDRTLLGWPHEETIGDERIIPIPSSLGLSDEYYANVFRNNPELIV